MQTFLAAILADANVSPAFQSAIAQQVPDQTAMPVRRAYYVSSLMRMPWGFETFTDPAAWQRAKDQLEHLRIERAEVDVDRVLWKRYAPEEFRHD